MSIDFPPELFATEVFEYMDHQCELLLVFTKLSKTNPINEFPTNFISDVGYAALCRFYFFKNKLSNGILQNYHEFSSTGIDFYLFILNNVDMSMHSIHMDIFEKVLMSLAFVFQMAFYCCSQKKDEIFALKAPLYWAMYFYSTLKDQFFAVGGWHVLHQHATRYKVSNLLDEDSIIWNFLGKNHFLNVTGLRDYVHSTFDVTALIEHYKEICMRRKRKACMSCQPMLTVLQSIFTKISSEFPSIVLIEGYFQLLLKLPKHCDMISAFERMKKLQFFKNIIACQEDLSTNIEDEHDEKERKKIFTDYFIQRVFIEKEYSEQVENSDIEMLDNACVFCSKVLLEICSESLPPEPWNCIKFRICETIEAEKSAKAEQTKKIESNELKPKTFSEVHQQKKSTSTIRDTNVLKEANTAYCSSIEKFNSEIDIEDGSNSVKISVDESGLLKMFSALGCKEETIAILINNDNKNENLSEAVNKVSLEEKQTGKNVKNISKKKKKQR